MKKVRKVRWHGVVRETLKAQASSFVLDPRFNWKPVTVTVSFQPLQDIAVPTNVSNRTEKKTSALLG